MSAVVTSGIVVVAAYLLGMFPTARLAGHWLGRDPTKEGSGNPGASNIYRLAGRRAGLVVMLGDMAKGAVPTIVALAIWGRGAALAAWLGAVIGHIWPVLPRLWGRGGKGAATTGGGGLVLEPIAGLLCLALFFAVAGFSRVAALGTLSVAVSYPALVAIFGWPFREVAVAVLVMGLVTIRHHSNLARLWRGTELQVRD